MYRSSFYIKKINYNSSGNYQALLIFKNLLEELV